MKYIFVAIWLAGVGGLWYRGVQYAQNTQILALSILAYLAAWTPFLMVSTASHRQRLVRFIAFNMALLLALAAVEVTSLAGVIDFRMVFGRVLQPWENPKNLLDPELVHIHRPHFEETGQMQGGDLLGWAAAPPLTTGEYRVRYDSNGFRNEQDYSEADLIVIGDSYVEAANVLPAQLLTTHIANSLNRTVVNLGQSCYGPQQELHVLKRFGVELKPKVCVWLFFEGNDLSDVWHYEKMVGEWAKTQAEYSSWAERSFLKNATVWCGQKMTPRSSISGLTRSGLIRGSDNAQRLWFGYSASEWTDREIQALTITKSVLKEAYEVCQQNNITFYFACAPVKFRIYGDLCEFEKDSYLNDWKCHDLPDRLSKIVDEICGPGHYINLVTEFRKHAADREVLYYPDDSHWSPAGHELAGRTIADFIRTAESETPSDRTSLTAPTQNVVIQRR